MNRKSAFTLLELSIVLVIIGLVVGGVLVGKDLIDSAKIQRTIKEASTYQNAVAAFKLKYGALPGDMTNPADFFNGYTSQAQPDGNGIIVSYQEGPDAWRQLSIAGMIDASIADSVLCNGGGECTYYDNQGQPTGQPASRGVDNGVWSIGVQSSTKRNVVLIGGPSTSWGDSAALLPLAASNIDNKLDDGGPTTGSVRQETATGSCLASGDYNLTHASPACSLSIQLGL